MRVVEAAVEARKVHVLQQETYDSNAKTYSFPVDSHLSQLTVQVTNFKTEDAISVKIRDPQGKQISKAEGLNQLMKTVPTVFVGSIDRPTPGLWTLEVSAGSNEKEDGAGTTKIGDPDTAWHSIRVTGLSEVDFLQGFATVPLPYNYGSSSQPIAGVKNYIMANMTGRFAPGKIEHFVVRSPNGTVIVRLPATMTESTQIYSSVIPLEATDGHYYLQVSGTDIKGDKFQRYSKVAYSARVPRPVVVTCPRKVEVRRGSSAEISCSIETEVPFTVQWYKGDDILESGAGTLYSFSTNVTHIVEDVNEESQGSYKLTMIPSITQTDFRVDGEFSDVTALIVLRKF
ncbi:hypothetical protein Ciccas_002675 [Cichlidogyrus casuarinus]|uniref:Ig-like domain-containing protein n=1 Tax=Cichlidogyrus casuarinus TaxID=1844966 RepID=A0ABD2QGJ4_9PLAT